MLQLLCSAYGDLDLEIRTLSANVTESAAWIGVHGTVNIGSVSIADECAAELRSHDGRHATGTTDFELYISMFVPQSSGCFPLCLSLHGTCRALAQMYILVTHMIALQLPFHLHSQWARLRHTKVACHIHVSLAPALTATRRSGILFLFYFTLVAEPRSSASGGLDKSALQRELRSSAMSGGTDRREDEQVLQFCGRIDEKFAEWEIDVRLWQVEFQEEDRNRLGPRLYRRGLHGQPKIIVKTKLGTQDVAQFTVDNIIKCLKDNGYGELPEELGQEALDNYFDMRQGKAESIQDYIFREEILTVALQKDTAIDLDEKIRGYWLMRTSNLTDREISGIKIITQGQTQLAQVKKAITQTIVAKKREEVRDDLREAGDRARDRPGGYAEAPNFHLHGNSDDDQADTTSESESNCSEQWYELDGQEQEALISLRDARKKLQHATRSRRFYPKGGGRGRARNTGKSIDELKKVTTCNRCGAIGHWEEDCSQPARSRKKRSPSAKGKGKKSSVQEREI